MSAGELSALRAEVKALRRAASPPSAITFEPIGHIESCFPEMRGCPRQGALMKTSRARLKLVPSISHHAFDGIEEYSHVWLLWSFHANRVRQSSGKQKQQPNAHQRASVKAKIRPPKKADGGKVGIFATRTPHRPNCIGQSLVRLERVERCFEGGEAAVAALIGGDGDGDEVDESPTAADASGAAAPSMANKKKKKKQRKSKRRETAYLHLSSIDLVDGTPILDIKPYIPLYEAVPEATVPDWVSSAYESAPLATRFTRDAEEQLRSIFAAAPPPGPVVSGAPDASVASAVVSAVAPAPTSRRAKRALRKKKERVRFYHTAAELQSAVCDLLALDIRSGATRTRRRADQAKAAAKASVEASVEASVDAPAEQAQAQCAREAAEKYSEFCLSFDRLKVTCRVEDSADAEAPESIVVVSVREEG